jgi:LPXTG-site transpeptidase (sortase) family protein
MRRRAPRQAQGWWNYDTVRLPELRGRGRVPGTRLPAVLRVAGEGFVTFGLVVLLLVAYQLWGQVRVIDAHQRDLNQQLSQAWGDPTIAPSASPSASASPAPIPEPPEGDALGRLYIPKLKLEWVVVQGVALKDIRYGPGHYPGTAMPGETGNFAVAGHRSPGIFWDLDQVQPDDYLIFETATEWFVYVVFQNQIVTPTSFEVIAATPDQPGVTPTQADITLTTCNPKWANYQRMAVHGTLLFTSPHDQRPSELAAM